MVIISFLAANCGLLPFPSSYFGIDIPGPVGEGKVYRVPQLSQMYDGQRVVDIAKGYSHSVALTCTSHPLSLSTQLYLHSVFPAASKIVLYAGSNGYGEGADPKEVLGGLDIKGVYAGYYYSIAVV